MASDPAADRLRQIATELYGRRPGEFTAARGEAERASREAGDKDLAKAVKALRRPTVAAWAVNLLVRERADLVSQVVELGESLRQAQALLQGDALRDLGRQRRRLVAAVTTEARALAEAEGERLGDPAARQVEETLQAAMTDRGAAEAVLSGLLAQPVTSTGLESLAEVLAVPPEPATDDRPRLRVVRDDGRARRAAEERVEVAGEHLRAAVEALEAARRKQSKAQARLLRLEAELEELRTRVAEAEQASEEAAGRLSARDAAVDEAAAAVETARQEADEAASALKALPRD